MGQLLLNTQTMKTSAITTLAIIGCVSADTHTASLGHTSDHVASVGSVGAGSFAQAVRWLRCRTTPCTTTTTPRTPTTGDTTTTAISLSLILLPQLKWTDKIH